MKCPVCKVPVAIKGRCDECRDMATRIQAAMRASARVTNIREKMDGKVNDLVSREDVIEAIEGLWAFPIRDGAPSHEVAREVKRQAIKAIKALPNFVDN